MDTVTQNDLRALAEVNRFPAVSIYIPTFRGGTDSQQNRVRFRNALHKADLGLTARRCSQAEVEEALGGGRSTLEDQGFWNEPADGLAMFLAGERQWKFWVPDTFTEVVHVGDRLVIAPLLAAVPPDGAFFVLALSENHARLFAVERGDIRLVEVAGLDGLREALHYDRPERQIQVVSTARFGKRKEGAVFHGQGAATAHEKSDLMAYCRTVDKAIATVLAREPRPLIAATTEALGAIFRQANSYDRLVDEQVHGSPDYWTESELLGRAAAAMESHTTRQTKETVERYGDLIRAGRASNDPREILQGACTGRVEDLLVCQDARLYGRFDRDSGTLRLTPEPTDDSDDLIETAVRETLLHGGSVRAVDARLLAAETPLLAAFRYSS